MSVVWILGRRVKIVANGHEYMAEPFVVFTSEPAADEAAEMVFALTGERPMKSSAALHTSARSVKAGQAGGQARAATLSPKRRSEIARKAAVTRHHGSKP